MFNPKENSEVEPQEQILRLNPNTGYYEGIFTVQVEPEIFRRKLFTYVEDYHIDPTDLVAWEKAVYEVARTGKWLNHPRAAVMPMQERHEMSVEPSPVEINEAEKEIKKEEKKTPPSTKYLPPEEEKMLWEKAMQLPVNEWETLLTPLPDELGSQDPQKRPYYVRRFVERKSLERLKEQLEPSPSERVEAIAEALNGARIK